MITVEKNVPMPDITIEKNVPIPEKEGLPRPSYSWLENMDVGDSFVFQGTKQELKAFRSTIRTRNWRHKGHMKWEWRWEWRRPDDNAMRIWRTE